MSDQGRRIFDVVKYRVLGKNVVLTEAKTIFHGSADFLVVKYKVLGKNVVLTEARTIFHGFLAFLRRKN